MFFFRFFLFVAVSLPANEYFIFDASPSVNTTENAEVVIQNVEPLPVKMDCTVTKVKISAKVKGVEIEAEFERVEYCSNSNCNYKKQG